MVASYFWGPGSAPIIHREENFLGLGYQCRSFVLQGGRGFCGRKGTAWCPQELCFPRP